MTIGVLYLDLAMPESRSLKDRRRAVKSLKERIQNRFNASVVELGDPDLWQSAMLAVCIIGNDVRHVNSQLSSVPLLPVRIIGLC
ncbi:MAG TPA: DUF503 domain-containing protein [Candidatus Hydrogenedentes bacterium]|nr:DUF503 domain-containing protein [Candidatus Hydrogenedentota bacterium]